MGKTAPRFHRKLKRASFSRGKSIRRRGRESALVALSHLSKKGAARLLGSPRVPLQPDRSGLSFRSRWAEETEGSREKGSWLLWCAGATAAATTHC